MMACLDKTVTLCCATTNVSESSTAVQNFRWIERIGKQLGAALNNMHTHHTVTEVTDLMSSVLLIMEEVKMHITALSACVRATHRGELRRAGSSSIYMVSLLTGHSHLLLQKWQVSLLSLDSCRCLLESATCRRLCGTDIYIFSSDWIMPEPCCVLCSCRRGQGKARWLVRLRFHTYTSQTTHCSFA